MCIRIALRMYEFVSEQVRYHHLFDESGLQ